MDNLNYKSFLPPTMRESMAKTIPGYLAEAIDQMLYGADTCELPTAPGSAVTRTVYALVAKPYFSASMIENKYIAPERVLLRVREYLELCALQEVTARTGRSMLKAGAEEIAYKGKEATP